MPRVLFAPLHVLPLLLLSSTILVFFRMQCTRSILLSSSADKMRPDWCAIMQVVVLVGDVRYNNGDINTEIWSFLCSSLATQLFRFSPTN